jgi:aminoglycoside phosphotransferase (APT) family kinase protein
VLVDPARAGSNLHTIQIRLEEHLRRKLSRRGLRVEAVSPVEAGHSGLTYFVPVSEGDWHCEYVLRLPPAGARIAGPADVCRQGRIMAALHQFGLPTPPVVANCEDTTVLDGRPFCLTERVAGLRIEDAAQRFSARDIVAAAILVLKRLQAVPIAGSGLGADPPVRIGDELHRWTTLMDRAPVAVVQRADHLASLLAHGVPPEPLPTLVHGDFHCGNLLFGIGGDGKVEVVAVLDWEIAQIGAPLLDVSTLCVLSAQNWVTGAPNPGGGLDLDPDDVWSLYGSSPHDLWYTALSFYKYAAILGYNLSLHRRGKRPDPMYEGLTEVIPLLIERGVGLLT